MNSLLTLHTRKLLFISLLAGLVLGASMLLGDTKAIAEINWLDVLGEGGSALAIAVWLVMILRSRPAGRVTNLLTLGLGFIFLAMWQDTLDEFFAFSASQIWENIIESGFFPMGLALLTYGLWHWHKEQLSIRSQLLKREQCFRDHLWIDNIGQVAGIDQVRAALLKNWHDSNISRTLVFAEIHNFSAFERRYGFREAERLLRESGEIIMLNLRQYDLMCRFARDRLVILLPSTHPDQAMLIAKDIQNAIQHFAFRESSSNERIHIELRIGVAVRQLGDLPEDLIEKGHRAIESASSGNGLSLVS
jgi:diguanylate cyclase (GGDEF)-like protein